MFYTHQEKKRIKKGYIYSRSAVVFYFFCCVCYVMYKGSSMQQPNTSINRWMMMAKNLFCFLLLLVYSSFGSEMCAQRKKKT